MEHPRRAVAHDCRGEGCRVRWDRLLSGYKRRLDFREERGKCELDMGGERHANRVHSWFISTSSQRSGVKETTRLNIPSRHASEETNIGITNEIFHSWACFYDRTTSKSLIHSMKVVEWLFVKHRCAYSSKLDKGTHALYLVNYYSYRGCIYSSQSVRVRQSCARLSLQG
jgi:hypothetical protein